MVSKITLFEVHLDGAQFGPASDTTEDEEHEESPVTAEADPESKSRLVMVLQGAVVFVTLFVTLWVVLSRVLSGDDELESE